MTINQQALDRLVEQLFGELSAGYGGVMVSLGDKLGLSKAWPARPAGLARARQAFRLRRALCA